MKAAVVLLLVAAGCVAAQNGTMSLGKGKNLDVTLDLNGIHKNVSASITDLHAKLTKAMAANSSTEGCECKEDCQEFKKTFCDVKEGEEEACEDVDVEDEVIVCKEKCYTADKVVTINVPTLDFSHLTGRRLSQSVAVTKKAGAVSVSLTKGAAANGTTAAAAPAAEAEAEAEGAVKAVAKEEGEGKKICRQICNRHPRVTKEKKCEMVPTKEFVNCEERTLAKKCRNVCKCADGKTVVTSTAPDWSNVTLQVPNKVEVVKGVASGAVQVAHALIASKN